MRIDHKSRLPRLANRPRMAGIVPELTHGVPCPGRGSFCPGNVKIDHRAWIYVLCYKSTSVSRNDVLTVTSREYDSNNTDFDTFAAQVMSCDIVPELDADCRLVSNNLPGLMFKAF